MKKLKHIVSNNLFLLTSSMVVWALVYRIIGESIKLPMDIIAFGIAGSVMLLFLSVLMDNEINAGVNDDQEIIKPTGVHMSDAMKGDKHEH